MQVCTSSSSILVPYSSLSANVFIDCEQHSDSLPEPALVARHYPLPQLRAIRSKECVWQLAPGCLLRTHFNWVGDILGLWTKSLLDNCIVDSPKRCKSINCVLIQEKSTWILGRVLVYAIYSCDKNRSYVLITKVYNDNICLCNAVTSILTILSSSYLQKQIIWTWYDARQEV